MRILAAADFHGSQYRLNLVLKHIEAEKPDVVVICGDLTQFGPGSVATNLLNQLPVETLAVHGNIDSSDVPEAIDTSKATNIHLKKVVSHGIPFIGIGGALPSSLFDLEIFDGTTKQSLKTALNESSVLVTHVPPYRLQDKIFIGTHGGSKPLRALVDAVSPRLVLCGHIHEDPGVTASGETTVVNCSMGKRTEGALIDVTDSINVRILG
ncbi:MAG TPA: metallophosphoesterase [Candidatus Thermoplasmatota archaeon]|nr:metallophosphoesterase [Candidatus Thermoplasmatota archaeon]